MQRLGCGRSMGEACRGTGTGTALASIGLLLVVAALLAACGAQGNAAKMTATATAQPAATATATHQGPPPLVLPYTFPAAWRAPQNGPTHVGTLGVGFAFAASDPQTGYACSAGPSPLSVTHDGGHTWQPAAGALPASSSYACGTVFVDAHDANDVFVTHGVPASDNPQMTTSQLLRSRDGGATWHALSQITYQGWTLGYESVAVVGSRLVVGAAVDGEGNLLDALYTSDDGGTSWQRGAQSLLNQGLQVGLPAVAGDSIFVPTNTPCTACAPNPVSAGAPYAMPFPSGGQDTTYYRSTDAGNTWTQVSIPGYLGAITRSADGSRYYCTASVYTSSYDQPTYYLSRDTCQTWNPVPALQGAEHGFVTAAGGIWPLPDGSLIADGMHNPQDGTHDPDCGLFHLGAGSSTWTPLAPNDAYPSQAMETSSGIRLWGVHPRDPLPLMYLDIPA